MDIRIWSKKIVAVLHHYQANPQTVLFGITGDIDNLGVYVATNGRAKAEILVDTYNRVIGSIFYQFLGRHPHMFHESQLLPAGEEVFILGTCVTTQIAEKLFQHLKNTPIPELIIKAGLDSEVTTTDVSFGCCILSPTINTIPIDSMLTRINAGDIVGANRDYINTMQQIRGILANQLDLEKFDDITQDEDTVVLLRNIVYAKTLQYKESTRELLLKIDRRLLADPALRARFVAILGSKHGLATKDHRQILAKLEDA